MSHQQREYTSADANAHVDAVFKGLSQHSLTSLSLVSGSLGTPGSLTLVFGVGHAREGNSKEFHGRFWGFGNQSHQCLWDWALQGSLTVVSAIGHEGVLR